MRLSSPLIVLLATWLTAATALHAQTAPKAAPPPAAGDDVIKLSEFNVKADDNRGYAASETLTGSRVATKIIDLPYSVNVLTSEFLADFGILELSDNLIQIGGFTGLDVGGGFNLRGFSSSSQLRDGFFRLGRYGASNVDRIEIIKGNNAAIYGRSSAGGMMNMISKAPKAKENQSLSYSWGTAGSDRVMLEATGPVYRGPLGKTNFVLTGAHFQKEFDQAYARNRNQEYFLSVGHEFNDGSNLTLSAEYFLQLRHSPNSAAPLIIDQKGTAATTDDVAVGYAKNLAKYNPFGPNSELTRGSTNYTAAYDRKFNEVWSTRMAANYYLARRWDFNQNTGWGTININPANPATPISTARGATPNRTRIIEDGGGYQGDLLAHYWTHDRKVEHRSLVTIDINDYYRWDPSLNYAGAGDADLNAWNLPRIVTLDANYNPVGPIAYFPKFYDASKSVYTRNQRRRITVIGSLLRQQTSFLDGRLLTFAGLRFDAVRFRDRDSIGFASPVGYVTGSPIDRKLNLTKPNLGFNLKITPTFRVYASYSQSYFVSQNDTAQNHYDPTWKPEVANGWDYGFKGSLLDDRLVYTVSGYYAVRQNVLVTDNVETPVGSGNYVQVNIRDGDQLVRGYEADLTWRITKEFDAGLSYGDVYSIYTNFGSAFPAAVGRRVNGVSPNNGSIYLKYTPAQSALKGFSANLGLSHLAKTSTEAPNAGDTYATVGGKRVVTSSTNQWNLNIPAFTLLNVGMRYKFPTSNRVDQTIALNVNNALDHHYLRVNRLIGEKREILLTYTINHAGAKR